MVRWLFAAAMLGIGYYLGMGDYDWSQRAVIAALPLSAAAAILLLADD